MKAVERHLKNILDHKFCRDVLKSKEHLDWVRDQNCVVTGYPGPDAHHVQRRSQGLNDYTAIPLTHHVHMQLHSKGSQTFEEMFCANEKDMLIAILIARIIELENGL